MKTSHILIRHLLLLALMGSLTVLAPGAQESENESFMLRMTHAYDAAWDRGDIAAMVEMFDPECVFRSPFQVRIGRDAVRDNVFKNWKRFRDSHTIETQAKIEGDLAYSFQESTMNDYGPEGGDIVKERRVERHVMIFSRRPGEDWKIRAIFVFDELPFSSALPVGK